jgi:hypothetical protein
VQENHFVSVGTPVYMPAGQFRCALWLRNELQSKFSVQIDEIVVRQVQLPAMVFDNTRIYAYDVQNRHLLIAYASVQRLSIPITLPGWTGGLDLDPFRMGGLLSWASVSLTPVARRRWSCCRARSTHWASRSTSSVSISPDRSSDRASRCAGASKPSPLLRRRRGRPIVASA